MEEQATKTHSLEDLNKLYNDGEEADREVFAEQRSNILLHAGEHYNRKAHRFNSRLRDAQDITSAQKLRLTKNHIHKIVRTYHTNIMAYSPDVAVAPKNPAEMRDQKEAELNQAVWLDAKDQYRLSEKKREWCLDFVGIGETAVKLFWDPNRGDFIGYEAKLQMDEEGNILVDEAGNPVPELDEQGQMIPDEEKPRFKGEFVFERIFGFNLIRPAGIKSMADAPWLCVRKMVDTKYLKKLYVNAPEKAQKIEESSVEDYIVFDSSKSEYHKTKDQTLLKEYYFRPCHQYPTGYYYIATNEVLLEEGELPFGLFPIIWQGFDEYPTTPRARSIVKVARPYQAEINRAASQMATHQVTIGDDKVIYQAGTKLAPGSLLPGVRGITYQGNQPQILPGRDGSQFLPYIQNQTEELYNVVDLAEENQETPLQVEPYTLLFASMKHRKKYSTYGDKFTQFLSDVCFLYLELAKKYLPDDALIYAIGKSEQINIAEFRNTTKLCYQIKLEERSDNMETALGKQLTFSHILQYVGTQMKPEDIGKLIKLMPFGNVQEGFEDFTLDYDNARNEMLSLDRGEWTDRMPKYDDQTYIVKKLTTRMNKPDFQFLPPNVQANYEKRLQMHEGILKQQTQAIIDAKNEFIPVGGALVACDLYVPNKDDPEAQAKRARLPYQALDWLVQKLETQGMTLDKMQQMNKAAVTDMATQIGAGQNGAAPQGGMPPRPMAPGQPNMMRPAPNASPGGASASIGQVNPRGVM